MNKLEKNISPLLKGAIGGTLMVAVSLSLYMAKISPQSSLKYLVYILYAAVIFWTLYTHKKSPLYKGTFIDLFTQGFRCFIIIALIMVIYTGVFTKMHPEFATEAAQYLREELVEQKNKTPMQIDEAVQAMKGQYTTSIIAATTFSTIIIGALFTAVLSLILIQRK